jgi:hypothetical protein
MENIFLYSKQRRNNVDVKVIEGLSKGSLFLFKTLTFNKKSDPKPNHLNLIFKSLNLSI